MGPIVVGEAMGYACELRDEPHSVGGCNSSGMDGIRHGPAGRPGGDLVPPCASGRAMRWTELRVGSRLLVLVTPQAQACRPCMPGRGTVLPPGCTLLPLGGPGSGQSLQERPNKYTCATRIHTTIHTHIHPCMRDCACVYVHILIHTHNTHT